MQRRTLPPYVVNTSLVEIVLQDRGWSIARLAREMSMDRSSVQNTIRGRSGVGPVFLQRLLDVFPKFRFDQLLMATATASHDTDTEAVA